MRLDPDPVDRPERRLMEPLRARRHDREAIDGNLRDHPIFR